MRSGKLNQWIDIQRKTTTGPADALGGNAATCWKTLYRDVQASVISMTGRELELAHLTVATSDVKVTCRYLGDITERDQIIWHDGSKDRVLGIGNINSGKTDREFVGRHIVQQFLCTEVK